MTFREAQRRARTDKEPDIGERHAALLEALDEGYCVIALRFDEHGRACDYQILEINPAFTRLTGIVDPVGRWIKELLPGIEPHWLATFGEVARTGRTLRFQNHAAELEDRWFDVLAYRVDEPEAGHVAVVFSDVTDGMMAAAERDAAQQREEEALALVNALLEGAPIGLAFLDRDLRFQQMNARFAEMYGLSPGDHVGQRPDELLGKVEGMDALVARWHQMLESGEPWLGVEVRGETAAQPGVQRTWIENFFPVRVGTKILGVGVVAEEITERRQAQEALARSEAKFRSLIELSPVGIAMSNPDGSIELANDAFLLMLGYTPDEAAQANWIERTPPELVAQDLERIEQLRRGEAMAPFEKRYVRRDGTTVDALVVAKFLPDEGERMVAFAVDITDRKRAEQRLRESEARLRMLIDHMAGFVAMLDTEGNLMEVGQPALNVSGLTRAEAIGEKFWNCPWWSSDAGQRERIKSLFYESLRGKTVREDVLVHAACDGPVELDLMLVPVFDANGKVTHVIPSGIDISERKRFEIALRENEERLHESALALREADRRKDVFLATLAHELRNPLAPLRNAVEILRLMSAGNATFQRTTEMMERQVQHLVRLVDDLLDISRITRGKVDLRRERVVLNEVVSGALEASGVFASDSHELRVQICPEPLTVIGDADRLRQVFSNLLSNAAKFTPHGGKIWVLLERSGVQALVRVRDNGVGIPPDRLQSVFEMFMQGPDAHRQDGLGIGLALVRQLVQLHGGTVTAESEGPGRGSQFTVCLPLAPRAEASLEQGTPSLTSAHPRRILVVDDNVDAAQTLQDMLRLQGHDVRMCTSGREAITQVARDPPDLIFMDLGMPEMDGLTAARRIRALPEGSHVRIVALTGWGQERDRQRTREAGMDAHLVKPVNPVELASVL